MELTAPFAGAALLLLALGGLLGTRWHGRIVSMSLGWPLALLALLVVPLLLLARWWFNRRRKRTAITVSSVGLIRAALPGRTAWRRRVPVALFLAGLALLALGVARPEAMVAVPRDNTSIILAMDASGSMCSTDVDPNRLTAAIQAAREFVDQSDDGTRIGLVAFAGIAGLLVPPTTEKDQLVDALESLKTSARHRDRPGDPHLDRHDRRVQLPTSPRPAST